MLKSKFTDSQVMEALKRVESGLSGPVICGELGIRAATFCKWRAKYGGMDISMISRFNDLQLVNARLREMYADERLKGGILQEAMGKKWLGHHTVARWRDKQ